MHIRYIYYIAYKFPHKIYGYFSTNCQYLTFDRLTEVKYFLDFRQIECDSSEGTTWSYLPVRNRGQKDFRRRTNDGAPSKYSSS